MTDVDTVVIGSGAGGLTAAVALARAGQRVLVLEQHYLPGGWCHSFTLEGHRFSPGVHYIGECQPGGHMARIYEGLGVSGDLLFYELDPDGYDRVRIGDARFEIPRGYERYVDRLQQAFPHERDGIAGYMKVIRALSSELATAAKIGGIGDALTLPLRARTLLRWGWRSLQALQDAYLSDPVLKGILTIQAGDHGMAPDRCPAGMHAAVAGHYFNGGYYPQGGGRALPRAFVRQLKAHGGDIRMRARVDRILVEDGRAIGVRLADGEEIRAARVVSNADPQVTFGQLLPPEQVPSRIRRKLDRATWSISAISLFMAAKIDPREAGLTSGNLWIARDAPSVAGAYRYAHTDAPLADGPVPGAFLTCTTLKDPSKHPDGVHTFEAFTFVSERAFRAWRDTEMGARPDGYGAFKQQLADRMLDCIDPYVPGLRDALTFLEVGTPLTNRYYCAATEGNLYGTEKRLGQLVPPGGWGLRTPIRDLWMCGASTISHGIAGATISGLQASQKILGCSQREILSARGPTLRVLPAEPDDRAEGATPEARVA